jgi:hypothetical protein
MLRIKKSQMAAYDEVVLEHFVDETVEHVAQHFPSHVKLLGPERTRAVVGYLVRQSRRHGLTTERSMCLYATLAMMLGGNFDRDLHLPWAGEILGGAAPQRERADALTDRALSYLDRTAGEDNLHLNQAFVRVRKRLPRLLEAPLASDLGFEESMLTHFGAVFPRKYDVVGEPLVRLSLRRGVEGAERYGLVSDVGRAVYTMFGFVLGSAFDEDPMLSPITEALADRAADERTRAAQLVDAAVANLDAWLSRA